MPLLFLLAACSADIDLSSEQREASLSWLALVDAGDYSASWTESSGRFQAAVAESDWIQQVRAARAPIGDLSKRAQVKAVFRTNLPGAPDGDYIIITYDSSFVGKAIATETHTLVHAADGSWRTAGYFIK